MASSDLNNALEENRRRAEVFRKGRITAVEEVNGVEIVTVEDGEGSRRMTTTYSGLTAGDVVVWVDQSDPFCLGKFAGT